MIWQNASPVMFLVYVLVFVGALLAFDGVRQMLFRRETETEARNRRMRLIRKGVSDDEILSLLRDPATMQGGGKLSLIMRLRRLLSQSGVAVGLYGFLAIVMVLALALTIPATMFLPPDLGVAAAVVVAPTLSIMVLMALRQDRAAKMTAQLPEALDMMARGLKVGHPLSVTVASVAKDMPDPIGSEFGAIQDQINYGDDVATAFREFADRVATEDARYLAVSVGIQHGTGGNLARVLNVLAKVIRDRQTMRKKIKAISAEGRLSGTILAVLPVAIFLSIHLTTPSFYGDVWNDPLFLPFAVAIVTLMVVQALVLYRLVKFKF